VAGVAVQQILALGADTIMPSREIVAKSTAFIQTFVFCWPSPKRSAFRLESEQPPNWRTRWEAIFSPGLGAQSPSELQEEGAQKGDLVTALVHPFVHTGPAEVFGPGSKSL